MPETKMPAKQLLSFIALFSALGQSWSIEQCYCVAPVSGDSTSSNDSCSDDCRPLQYYASGNFTFDNTTFYTFRFLPGTHSLSAVFYAEYLSNLQFRVRDSVSTVNDCDRESRPAVIVECNGNNSGFHFRSIVNLTIFGLTFNNCGYEISQDGGDTYWNAFFIHYVRNLQVVDVAICNSKGVGVYGYEVVGDSTIQSSVVSSSKRAYPGSSSSSGNIHLYYEYRSSKHKSQQYSITIEDSRIVNGENGEYLHFNRPHAGGLFLYLSTTNALRVELRNVNMTGNSGYNGGNAAVDYIAVGNSWLSTIIIHNCRFIDGNARGFGAGLYVNFVANYHEQYRSDNANITLVLEVTDSVFEHNKAGKVGAGAYIQLHENSEFQTIANVSFVRCNFTNNSINSTTGRGGSAVNVINFKIPDYIQHHLPQFMLSFTACVLAGNRAVILSRVSLGSSALYVEENAYMRISGCEFVNNLNCSGVSAVHSNLMLEGEIKISNNTAVNGGGIVLCANSVFKLSSDVTLILSDNHATRDGGGIFNEDDCLQAIPPCFFQLDSTTNLNKTVFLLNNTAARAGSAIYGGSVDYCYYYGPYLSKDKRYNVFDNLFEITTSDPSDRSNISSNPLRVCFCNGSTDVFNCTQLSVPYDVHVFSGGQVRVEVVVVGQREGTVPGIVMAEVVKGNVLLKPHESSQFVNSIPHCETVTYTIESEEPPTERNQVLIKLFTENNFRNTSQRDTNIYIELTVLPCPPGFGLNNNTYTCQCSAELEMLPLISCNISDTSITRERKSAWWIGFDSRNHVMYQENCPFDYCVTDPVSINVTQPSTQDRQCAHKRKGVLCGECQTNTSIVFGSTHCYDCSDSTVWMVLGKIIFLLLVGIGLVLFMGIVNLNVSEGTLNAFVFYMNVVRFNTSYFDISRDANLFAKWMSVFVAWINLDIGRGVCFYNGMTILAKTGLQFVFPFYLWSLAALIICLGRRYSWVGKIFGTYTVKVLATIILHSYAKLIRAVIEVWSSMHMKSSDHDKGMLVWTLNGNIVYFHNQKHLALFVLAVVVALVTLPYTLALLFIPCLRRKSNMKVLFWVSKLKPFFDAYTGPYKDKYHFWTGFLLMVRILLFVSITATGSPPLNLTLIIATACILIFLMQKGIYKNRVLNVIETFSLLNLIVFTALTSYDRYDNEGAIVLCIGSMFLLFCGIIVYHILKKVSVTRRWGLMKVWLLDRRWPWMKRKPIRSLILPYVDPDNDEYLSSSEGELDPILHNAPPVARYDEYREPLIETTRTD